MVAKRGRVNNIQKKIFYALVVLVSAMTIIVAGISIMVNIHTERRNMDQNLKNVASTISGLQFVQIQFDDNQEMPNNSLSTHLDSIKKSMTNIDVISIVGKDGVRKYHTNSNLIGTLYDGTMPDFVGRNEAVYVSSDIGPSGAQRRAYAAIYDEKNNYLGFVLAVMLDVNMNKIIWNTVAIHMISAVVVILLASILSKYLSNSIKQSLHGYEPDIFGEMFAIRNEILESLEEGIIEIDQSRSIVYMNQSAKNMLKVQQNFEQDKILSYLKMDDVLRLGERDLNVPIRYSHGSDIIVDKIPVMREGMVEGGLCILRDRTEYTKMMEDLSGVKYMVESMRANNHDFTNKLHVILGLIQMGNVKMATEYIAHITSIQQNLIHNIMTCIEDPSIAALLIGKYSRAAELNIKFSLENGSRLSRNDMSLPPSDLVTIIGNLLENAMDSINEKDDLCKELSVGIFSHPHALIIQVDDTGQGIREEDLEKIYEKGFTTKGTSHGTGLYIVNRLVHEYNGAIDVNSEYGIGTSFTITLTDEERKTNV